jgi:hypothetical protein
MMPAPAPAPAPARDTERRLLGSPVSGLLRGPSGAGAGAGAGWGMGIRCCGAAHDR